MEKFDWPKHIGVHPAADLVTARPVTRTDRATADARSMLAMLRARYDDGAVSPALYQAIRKLETDIACAEHRRRVGAGKISENHESLMATWRPSPGRESELIITGTYRWHTSLCVRGIR